MSYTTGEIYLIMQNRRLNADFNNAIAELSEHYAGAVGAASRNARIAKRNADAAKSASREVATLTEMIALLEIENTELRSCVNQLEGERDQALSLARDVIQFTREEVGA